MRPSTSAALLELDLILQPPLHSVAYIHATLTFRRSPLAESVPPSGELSGLALEDARAMLDHLLSLVPFVEESKSTVLLASVKDARLYTNSHLDPSVSPLLGSASFSLHGLTRLLPTRRSPFSRPKSSPPTSCRCSSRLRPSS